MEVAGRNAAQKMHTWIREEFAYITHKRDLEISDSEEERRIRQELQIHEFNGGNSKDWILQLEDFFEFFQLNEEAKLKVAIIGLDDDARRWFEDEHRRLPFYDWQELKGQMLRQFCSTSTPSWQAQSDSMQCNDKEKRLNSSLGYGYGHGGEAEFPGDCNSESHSVVVAEELQEDPGIEEEDEKCENSDLKKIGEDYPTFASESMVVYQIVGPRKGATCGDPEDGFKEVAGGYTGEGRRGFMGRKSGDNVFMDGGINPHQGVNLQHDAVKRRQMVQQGPVGCGSGGGPGNFAGCDKFGVGTASYGGLRDHLGSLDRERRFLRGGSAASGSGGGPGKFSGEKLGVGSILVASNFVGDEDERHPWRGLQKFPDLEQQRRNEIWVGLTKKPRVKKGSNGNFVNVQRSDILTQPISTSAQPIFPFSILNPTSFNELGPLFASVKTRPLTYLFINHSTRFLELISTNSHLTNQPNFFFLTIPFPTYQSLEPLFCNQIIVVPLQHPSTHHTKTPPHATQTFNAEFHNPFILVVLPQLARGLSHKELQHKLKQAPCFVHEELNRGQAFSADYDPP